MFFRNIPECTLGTETLLATEGLKEEWALSQPCRQPKRAQAKASIMHVPCRWSPEIHERMDYVFSRKKRNLSSPPVLGAKVTLTADSPS